MIIIDSAVCTGCGECARDCTAKVIEVKNGLASVSGDCFMCGHCVAVCPLGAVRVEGGGYSMDDVIPTPPPSELIPYDVMLTFIRARRSVRRFTDEPVSREDMARIIEAGRFSPTACNNQDVAYTAFIEKTDELRAIAMDEFRKLVSGSGEEPPFASSAGIDLENDDFLFRGAPAILLVKSPNPANGLIAASNMELAVASLGLGAVYIGFFVRLADQSPRIREYLGLREDEHLSACLAIGHPAVRYPRTAPRLTPEICWR